jgi:hypothetical protein
MIEGVLFRRGVVLVSRRALFHVLFSPDRLVERRFFFSCFHFSLLYDISSQKSLFVNRHTAFGVDCATTDAACVDFNRQSDYLHRCLRSCDAVRRRRRPDCGRKKCRFYPRKLRVCDVL